MGSFEEGKVLKKHWQIGVGGCGDSLTVPVQIALAYRRHGQWWCQLWFQRNGGWLVLSWWSLTLSAPSKMPWSIATKTQKLVFKRIHITTHEPIIWIQMQWKKWPNTELLVCLYHWLKMETTHLVGDVYVHQWHNDNSNLPCNPRGYEQDSECLRGQVQDNPKKEWQVDVHCTLIRQWLYPS